MITDSTLKKLTKKQWVFIITQLEKKKIYHRLCEGNVIQIRNDFYLFFREVKFKQNGNWYYKHHTFLLSEINNNNILLYEINKV